MKKIIMLSAAVLLAFAACEKPVPYEPGAQMDVNGPNVYFSNTNSIDLILQSDETEFGVAVLRSNADKALNVPLKALTGYDGAFEVPATVEFPAGVDSVVVAIKLSESFEMFKDYTLTLSIPEEYTHAYLPQDETPNLTMAILQEDFVPYAAGTYSCGFCAWGLGWGPWEQVLEYSAIKETYRFSNLWRTGTFMTFKWDGADTFTFEENVGFVTGISAGYGPIKAYPIEGTYDSESNTMLIKADMIDTSSWGVFDEIFVISETF